MKSLSDIIAEVIGFLIVIFCFAIILYGLLALAEWNVNPFEWHIASRLILTLASGAWGVVIIHVRNR
jgi:hypothetical protein